MNNLRIAAQRMLDATEDSGHKFDVMAAADALRAALAQEQAEPVQEMPSNTRYTVAIEGQALTYWDNIHDAVTNAQRAVYADVDATTRAIDDLRVGRLAEWSYGFSAVRIYPPQRPAEPVQEPAATTQQPADEVPPSDYRRGYWDGFAIGKREGRIEAEDAALKAQEQAEPKGGDNLSPPLQAEPDLSRCPQCNGPADNGHDRSIPPNPYLCTKCMAEPVAWLQPKTMDAHLRPDLGYETCSSADYGAFPVYTAPPQRQPFSGLEVERLLEQVIGSLPAARNLVRAVERAHGIIGSEIRGDSHQTLDDAMHLPRAMAQAYESGYNAGVANEREACATVCESRFMGDLTREDMEARRCAAAIRARGEMP